MEMDKMKQAALTHFGVARVYEFLIQKDTCTPMFIAALFTIAKT